MSINAPSNDQRFTAGKATFEKITGLPAAAFLDGLKGLAPAFGRYVMEWEFADVYGESSLDPRVREIVMVAACAALGATALPILKLRLGSALRAGVSRQELIDVCIQVGLPAGLPAALTAIQAAGEVFAEADA